MRLKKLIALALWRKGHRAELRADFRRFYSCRYDEVERASPLEAADLAFFLPRGSAFKAALDPSMAWTDEQVLLAEAVNAIGRLGGAKKPLVKIPKPKRGKAKPSVSVDVDELAEALSRPRREV